MSVISEYVARPPRLWQKVFLVIFAGGIPFGLADERGWIVGGIAAVIYGGVAIAAVLAWEPMRAWSAKHPVLDSLFVVPFLFLFLAYATSLSTALCSVIALGVGLAVVALAALLRSTRAGRTSTAPGGS